MIFSVQKIYSIGKLLKCSPGLSDTKMKKDMVPVLQELIVSWPESVK